MAESTGKKKDVFYWKRAAKDLGDRDNKLEDAFRKATGLHDRGKKNNG